jgi:hypothetical protein
MDTPIDPQTSAVATQVASAAVEEAKGLFGKFLGPACEEMGSLIGEHVRVFRLKNQIRILKRAKKILTAEGLEPEAVNLKTFVPLLEAGALEEDEEMAERWASLLASAATPAGKQTVEPSFIEILRQLTPLQARILDALYQHIEKSQIPDTEWNQRGILSDGLRKVLQIEFSQFLLSLDNLVRLRLVGFPSIGLDFISNKDARFQLANNSLLCGTHLGNAFIKACRVCGVASDSAEVPTGDQKNAQHTINTDPVWL